MMILMKFDEKYARCNGMFSLDPRDVEISNGM